MAEGLIRSAGESGATKCCQAPDAPGSPGAGPTGCAKELSQTVEAGFPAANLKREVAGVGLDASLHLRRWHHRAGAV